MRVGRVSLALCAVTMALTPYARANDPGDVTLPFNLGTSVDTYNFAHGATPASSVTLGDQVVLSEFVGAGVFVSHTVRVGLNLQFSEVVVQPRTPFPSTFTQFAFLPQLNWNFWGPVTVSFVPSLSPWFGGKEQFAFGLQGVLGVAIPLGSSGFAATAAVEIPVYLTPVYNLGITPLLGVSYRLPRRTSASAALPPPEDSPATSTTDRSQRAGVRPP